MNSFCAMYSFRMSFCSVPAIFVQSPALLLDRHQVHGPKHIGGRIDGHRNAGLLQVDSGEERFHVFQGVDGHPALAHLPFALRSIRVITHQGGQVEGDGKTAPAIGQQVSVACVGLLRCGKTGELAHSPEFAPVASAMDPPRVRGLPWTFRRPILRQIRLGVEPAHRNTGDRGEPRLIVGHGYTSTDQHSKRSAVRPGHPSMGAPHPRFPVKLSGLHKLHAPFLNERRTRGLVPLPRTGN